MVSIKHNYVRLPITLPDMRNLGVQLRVLVLANAMAVIAALLRASQPADAWEELLRISAVMQPALLASVLVLFFAHRLLQQLPYHLGVIAVFAIVLSLTTLLHYGVITPFWEEGSTPALWRLWLFTALMTGILLLYFNLRGRALSPAITEARLQALQARIRPHFLFNSINAVLSLIRSDPRRAETALEDLADLFRVQMADNRCLVQLAGELELCRQYLGLEKLRLGERLHVVWHTDHMPADALVPPLMLQPLLENAVYHGIEPIDARGEIVINIFRRGGQLFILLSNPYRANSSRHTGNSMALANIRERLALHFDAEARLDTQITESRYQVRIVLPYRT